MKPHRKLALISQAWKGSDVEKWPKKQPASPPGSCPAFIDLRHYLLSLAWRFQGMVKCKLLKLNMTDLDTCKHPAPHTHTHNKWHCAHSKCAHEPTHSRYCCCARSLWAPCALQPSPHPPASQVQHPLPAASSSDNTTHNQGFYGWTFPIFAFCSLWITCILLDLFIYLFICK